MPIAPGQAVGSYEILELIENNKDGISYKVRNPLLDRYEVLRVLPKSVQDDPEQVTRFLREAKVHSRMNHPNIVSFYNATQLDGQLIMTSELVEGATLAGRVEAGGVKLEEALTYISQVLSALEYAHSLGVVHRNVTASNVILPHDGAVKLGGFALAKAASDPQLTQPGTVIGSLDYISPEQVKGRIDLDARTDIYSTGVVLYEAVTGQKPFRHKSQFEMMMAHVNELPTAPTMLNPDVPAEVSEIVMTAMAKDPKARFQSAAEFRGRIDRLRGVATEPQPSPKYVYEPVRMSRDPDGPREWSRWELIAAGSVTFVVLVWMFLAILRHVA